MGVRTPASSHATVVGNFVRAPRLAICTYFKDRLPFITSRKHDGIGRRDLLNRTRIPEAMHKIGLAERAHRVAIAIILEPDEVQRRTLIVLRADRGIPPGRGG
jgi:hypothetical protein